MNTRTKRGARTTSVESNKNAGIKLTPDAKEFSVDPMYQTSVVTAVAYGKLGGSGSDFQRAEGELGTSGVKPPNGYPGDTPFYLNINYGDDRHIGSDAITFEDFEAVVIAMQDLRATAIANGLSASPSMTAFNPSQPREQ